MSKTNVQEFEDLIRNHVNQTIKTGTTTPTFDELEDIAMQSDYYKNKFILDGAAVVLNNSQTEESFIHGISVIFLVGMDIGMRLAAKAQEEEAAEKVGTP